MVFQTTRISKIKTANNPNTAPNDKHNENAQPQNKCHVINI